MHAIEASTYPLDFALLRPLEDTTPYFLVVDMLIDCSAGIKSFLQLSSDLPKKINHILTLCVKTI